MKPTYVTDTMDLGKQLDIILISRNYIKKVNLLGIVLHYQINFIGIVPY